MDTITRRAIISRSAMLPPWALVAGVGLGAAAGIGAQSVAPCLCVAGVSVAVGTFAAALVQLNVSDPAWARAAIPYETPRQMAAYEVLTVQDVRGSGVFVHMDAFEPLTPDAVRYIAGVVSQDRKFATAHYGGLKPVTRPEYEHFRGVFIARRWAYQEGRSYWLNAAGRAVARRLMG